MGALEAPLDEFVMSGSCGLVKRGAGRPGSQQEGPARDAACPMADAAARAGGAC